MIQNLKESSEIANAPGKSRNNKIKIVLLMN